MWINKIFRLFPKKKIQIGKTAEEFDRLSDEYFKAEREEAVVAKKEAPREGGQEEACEYEVLEREVLPAKMICPACGGITLEGLDYCDKCGRELSQ